MTFRSCRVLITVITKVNPNVSIWSNVFLIFYFRTSWSILGLIFQDRKFFRSLMDQERIPSAALETNYVDIRCDFSWSSWHWLLPGKEWSILVWQLFKSFCFPHGIASSPFVFLTLSPTRLFETINRKWLIFNYKFKNTLALEACWVW